MRRDAVYRNELVKMIHRPATLVTVGLYALLTGAFFGASWYTARNQAGVEFSLPGAWSQVVGGNSQATWIFGSVLLILLVAGEFSWRTARQNVIDGVSKQRWYLGKAFLVPALAVLFVGLQVGLGGGFAMAGTELSELPRALPEGWHVAALGGVLLGFTGYATLALLAAVLLRSTGAAMAVWFFYVVAGESMLQGGLRYLGGVASETASYLPVEAFGRVARLVQYSPVAQARAAARAAERGAATLELMDTGLAVAVAAAWIAALFAVGLVSFRRRDL